MMLDVLARPEVLAAIIALASGLILAYVNGDEERRRLIRRISSALLLVLLVGAVVEMLIPRSAEATITSPESGVVAAGAVGVKGTAAHIDEDTLWLAVYAVDGRRYYPVAERPEMGDDGEWSVTAQLEPGDAPTARFELVAFTVDEEAAASLEAYVEQSTASGGYPGLLELPDGAMWHDRVAIICEAAKPTPPTTTTTSTTAVVETTTRPPQLLLPLVEAESGLGGVANTRTHASGDAAVLLHSGESLVLTLDVAELGSYEAIVRYANDNFGPAETITLRVDGEIVGVFEADDTGEDGMGWNTFVLSPPIPAVLTEGSHGLEMTVSGGDGHGVELDAIAGEWPQQLLDELMSDEPNHSTLRTPEPPATEPPTTEPRATEPPATEPPTTEPPTTEPPATEPPTTTSSPPGPLVAEAEDGRGDGEIMERGDASEERTVLVDSGTTWTIDVDLMQRFEGDLHLRYSNDNFGDVETIEIVVDGLPVAQFAAEDTGDFGAGWNVFVWSPAFGVELDPGTHTVELHVVGGDAYGIEFDVLAELGIGVPAE